jgi:hypothetical protein
MNELLCSPMVTGAIHAMESAAKIAQKGYTTEKGSKWANSYTTIKTICTFVIVVLNELYNNFQRLCKTDMVMDWLQ